MEAKAIASDSEAIEVSKHDLVEAWKVLEKVVVSLRKMGNYYSTPGEEVPLSPKRRKQMLDDLDAYFTPELARELGRARRLLVEYLPEEETESLSKRLPFWKPKDH